MQEGAARIEERIKKVIVERLKMSMDSCEITKDTPLIGKGLGLDSIGILELVVGLEEEFKIFFNDTELNMELFENIGSLANFISSKQYAQP